MTNTGNSVLNGDLGIDPNGASSITGFPPGKVNGTTYAADGVAMKALADATTAYNNLAGALPVTEDLSGDTLGVTITSLPSGIYKFNSSAQLTGTLTLTGSGPWVFQIGSTLTTASDSAIIAPDNGANVYWQVGSRRSLARARLLREQLSR